MKLVWNKETKNEEETYYRDAMWLEGISVVDDFSKDNFTEIAPTTIYCNWVTDNWVVDTAAKDAADAVVTLDDTDVPLVRVLEDLVNTLITKGTIVMGDLPQEAQDKLAARAAARDDL